MAERAFALLPLSASARTAAPADADYEAIREAFMETARGRWFLGEYAKRNRNADTAMVLEAVARIERSMATAKVEQVLSPEPPLPDPALAALHDAKSSIEAILAESRFEDAVSRWRRSSRIIQEIAWALRETGSDPRICDILESQVHSIETACAEFSGSDIRNNILGVLDDVLRRISPTPDIDPSVESVVNDDLHDDTAGAATREIAAEIADGSAPVVEATSHLDQPNAELPAIQSAAEPVTLPVTEENSAFGAISSEATATVQVVEQAIVAETTNGNAVLPEPTHPPASDLTRETAPSLGESLIAQGLIKQPLSDRADPLAQIRRMSHAEKIAFFS